MFTPPFVTMENEQKQENAAPPPLPLGWTQVRRKKRTRDGDETANAADEIDWCCDDPNCKRTLLETARKEETPPTATTVQGTAIFCLHDTDPRWFQGYLQIQGQRKPWGLLAVQETLDECLECKDGGYRQVTLKVFSYKDSKNKEPRAIENIQWTGGDMMRLQSPEVSMETHSLMVGKKAVPFVDKYFASLVEKLREGENNDSDRDDDDDDEADTTVLGLLPDLAILTGPMTLTLSDTAAKNEESNTIDENDDKNE